MREFWNFVGLMLVVLLVLGLWKGCTVNGKKHQVRFNEDEGLVVE